MDVFKDFWKVLVEYLTQSISGAIDYSGLCPAEY